MSNTAAAKPVSREVLRLLDLSEAEMTSHDQAVAARESERVSQNILAALQKGKPEEFMAALEHNALSPQQVAQLLMDQTVHTRVNEVFRSCFEIPNVNFELGFTLYNRCAPDRPVVLEVMDRAMLQLMIPATEERRFFGSEFVFHERGFRVPNGYKSIPFTPALLCNTFAITREEMLRPSFQAAYQGFLAHCLERVARGYRVPDKKLGQWGKETDTEDAKYAVKLLETHINTIPVSSAIFDAIRPKATEAVLSIIGCSEHFWPDKTRTIAEDLATKFGVDLTKAPRAAKSRALQGFIISHLDCVHDRDNREPERNVVWRISEVISHAKALGADEARLKEAGTRAYLRALSRGEPEVATQIKGTHGLYDSARIKADERSACAIQGMRKGMFGVYGGFGEEYEYGKPPMAIDFELELATKLEREGQVASDTAYWNLAADYIARIINRIGARFWDHRQAEWGHVQEAILHFRTVDDAAALDQALETEPVTKAASAALWRMAYGEYYSEPSKRLALTLASSGLVPANGVEEVVVKLLRSPAESDWELSQNPWKQNFGCSGTDLGFLQKLLEGVVLDTNTSEPICAAVKDMCRTYWLRPQKGPNRLFHSGPLTDGLKIKPEVLNAAASELIGELLLNVTQHPANLEQTVAVARDRGTALTRNELIRTLKAVFDKEAELGKSLPKEKILAEFQPLILGR